MPLNCNPLRITAAGRWASSASGVSLPPDRFKARGAGEGMDGYLETPRLVLRRFTPEDVDNLRELDSDPEVMRRLTGGQPTPYDDIRDLAIPRFLAYHQELEGLGYWAVEE